jgi:hypothetical protein
LKPRDWQKYSRGKYSGRTLGRPIELHLLHAIAVAPMMPQEDKVLLADPRQEMIDIYMQMRERGELARDITPRKPEPPVIERQRAPKPPEDDDADGVAV